jgi:general secretion pathway protein K
MSIQHRPGSHCVGARAGRQQGAALLAAMLTVTLVATLAAAALWQQWRNVEVEAAERARMQTGWLLMGAQDWARLILREDARSGGADYLSEPWAVPLQESRLSSFLASGSDTSDTAQDAFLSGQIIDLQSRMNVLNLVEDDKISPPTLASFGKLFELLGLPPQELTRLAKNLLLAVSTVTNQLDAPVMPQRTEQLTWLGLSAPTIEVLKPFVTVLPERTPVNLNTASAEVIYASIAGLEMADAQRLVTERSRAHFRTLAEVNRALTNVVGPLDVNQFSVATRYFEVRGRLRLEQAVVENRSLVQRDGLEVKTLWRDNDAIGSLPIVRTSSLQ